jgi:hypothetical protein
LALKTVADELNSGRAMNPPSRRAMNPPLSVDESVSTLCWSGTGHKLFLNAVFFLESLCRSLKTVLLQPSERIVISLPAAQAESIRRFITDRTRGHEMARAE